MAQNFPSNPTNNQTLVINGVTYTWDGTKWDTTNFASNIATVYNTTQDLPTTGISNGDMAWVGGTTNQLYISNGSGWYSTTLTNDVPVIVSVEDASSNTTPFSLATDGTATVITVSATDPENMTLTYSYSVTTGSLGSTASVSQSNNEFTITPSTTEADAGTFGLTFTVSDGANDVTSVADFSLTFQQPANIFGNRGITFMTDTTGTSGGNRIEYFNVGQSSGSASLFGENTITSTSNTLSVSDGNLALNSTGGAASYVTVATLGNAASWGSIGANHNEGGSTQNATYGVFADGTSNTGGIDRITIATVGSASEYMGLTSTQRDPMAGACTNGTRGVFAGGYASSWSNVIDYVTIDTLAGATSLGTLGHSGIGYSGAVYDGTYGVWCGGYGGSGFAGNNINNRSVNILQRLNLSSGGSCTNHGDLNVGSTNASIEGGAYGCYNGANDGTYGAVAGGLQTNSYSPSVTLSTISRITIASSGNSTSIGDLTIADSNTATTQGNA